MNIRTEKVEIPVAGEAKPMMGWLAVPEGAGPHPAVIVIEEIFGVNAQMRDITERVAKEGYVAVAPHVHHRAAPELDLPYNQEGMQQGMQLIPKLTVKGALADLNGTIAFLRARKDVRGDRIGCMGFCIGGHLAYLAACATDVRATAAFYGGGIANYGLGDEKPTVEKTPGIKGRILCLFGKEDPMISADQVKTIQSALERAKVRHEIVSYDGASHAFFRDKDPHAHRPDAAADAWQRVKKLFAEELKG